MANQIHNLKNGMVLISTEVPAGLYTSVQLKTISKLCDGDLAMAKATEDQRIALFVEEDQREAVIAELKAVGLGIRNFGEGLHSPISCIGDLCPKAEQNSLDETMAITDMISKMDWQNRPPLKIGINSCSSCCIASHTLDVSLVANEYGYRLNLGGKNSQIPELGSMVAEGIPGEKLPGLLKQVIEYYLKHSELDETLEELIMRSGVSGFIEILAPYSQDAPDASDPFSQTEPDAPLASEEPAVTDDALATPDEAPASEAAGLAAATLEHAEQAGDASPELGDLPSDELSDPDLELATESTVEEAVAEPELAEEPAVEELSAEPALEEAAVEPEPELGELAAEPALEEAAAEPEPELDVLAEEPALEEAVAEPEPELDELTEEPAVEEAVAEPALEEAVAEPELDELAEEPAVEEVAEEPAVEAAAVEAEPELDAVAEEPAVEEAAIEPAVEEVAEEPALEEAVAEPELAEEPAVEAVAVESEPELEPELDAVAEEPAVEEAALDPAIEEAAAEPALEDAASEPELGELAEEPALEEAVAEPSLEEVASEPALDEVASEPAMVASAEEQPAVAAEGEDLEDIDLSGLDETEEAAEDTQELVAEAPEDELVAEVPEDEVLAEAEAPEDELGAEAPEEEVLMEDEAAEGQEEVSAEAEAMDDEAEQAVGEEHEDEAELESSIEASIDEEKDFLNEQPEVDPNEQSREQLAAGAIEISASEDDGAEVIPFEPKASGHRQEGANVTDVTLIDDDTIQLVFGGPQPIKVELAIAELADRDEPITLMGTTIGFQQREDGLALSVDGVTLVLSRAA